jgi:hypothetical protein
MLIKTIVVIEALDLRPSNFPFKVESYEADHYFEQCSLKINSIAVASNIRTSLQK